MKWTLGFLTLVVAVVVSGQTTVSSPPFNPTTESAATTPPVTTTTEPTSTTTEPTSTTTEPPTTTSQATSTEVTSSTDAPPTTTAETTTSEVPITTEKPSKEWVVKDENGVACLKAYAVMKFKIKNLDNKVVEVPVAANVSGQCQYIPKEVDNYNYQHLRLNFLFESQEYEVNMVFKSGPENEHSTKTVVKVSEWSLKYTTKEGNLTTSVVTEPILQFNGNNSYDCTYTRKFKMTLDNSLDAGELNFSPFMVKGAKLDGAETCEEDKTNDIVPIAVGCALAALVIIVLIAYLIGRRRSRQKGYQSV